MLMLMLVSLNAKSCKITKIWIICYISFAIYILLRSSSFRIYTACNNKNVCVEFHEVFSTTKRVAWEQTPDKWKHGHEQFDLSVEADQELIYNTTYILSVDVVGYIMFQTKL